MLNSLNCLLFATDLSEDCRPALAAAVAAATTHQAKLVLLYVIAGESPQYIEQELKGLVGEEKWEKLKKEQEENAQKALIGKMSYRGLGQEILRQYCINAEIDANKCNFTWEHIVSSDKDLPEAIIKQANENGCELIVLGARKGFGGRNHLGATTKKILQRSKVPVLIVPSKSDD
jgi:nucleotide-binding universal stress UspA family protein